jgi:hypothetical protein
MQIHFEAQRTTTAPRRWSLVWRSAAEEENEESEAEEWQDE